MSRLLFAAAGICVGNINRIAMIQLSIHKLESLVVSASFNRKSRGPPPATGVRRASRAQAVPPNRGQPPPESAARNRRARPRSGRRRGSRRARVEVGGGCRGCRLERKLPRPPGRPGPAARDGPTASRRGCRAFAWPAALERKLRGPPPATGLLRSGLAAAANIRSRRDRRPLPTAARRPACFHSGSLSKGCQ